jgi:hypothetical protein
MLHLSILGNDLCIYYIASDTNYFFHRGGVIQGLKSRCHKETSAMSLCDFDTSGFISFGNAILEIYNKAYLIQREHSFLGYQYTSFLISFHNNNASDPYKVRWLDAQITPVYFVILLFLLYCLIFQHA